MKTAKCVDCECAVPQPVRGRTLRCTPCNQEHVKRKRRVTSRPKLLCVDCDVVFDPPRMTGQLPVRCTPCKRERLRVLSAEKSRRWRESNPEYFQRLQRESYQRTKDNPGRQAARERYNLKAYGLTPDTLKAMLIQQNHLCAICNGEHVGIGDRLHVDHDHKTGKVRALLCGPCNVGLGAFGDDPLRLDAAARYLRHHVVESPALR